MYTTMVDTQKRPTALLPHSVHKIAIAVRQVQASAELQSMVVCPTHRPLCTSCPDSTQSSSMTGLPPVMTLQSSHVSLGCFLSIGYSYALLIRFSALLLRRLGPPRGLPGSCQYPALNHSQLMCSAMLPFLPSGVPQRQAASKKTACRSSSALHCSGWARAQRLAEGNFTAVVAQHHCRRCR
jgi:hypothetical protein